jgi:hypothetical protein
MPLFRPTTERLTHQNDPERWVTKIDVNLTIWCSTLLQDKGDESQLLLRLRYC